MSNCCSSNVVASNSAEPCAIVAPVFLAYEKQLKAFVYKQIKDKQEAEDILQQLYLKLYKNCEKLQDVQNMKAWLYQITRNTVSDFFRENAKKGYLSQDAELPEELSEESLHELEGLVEPMINLLPEEYAKPLRLSELEGISQKEVAVRLGLSHSGAKSRVQRGREKLKALFMECCHLEFGHDGQVIGASVKASCKPLSGTLKSKAD